MKKGISLIEVLVASVILALTISGTLFGFVVQQRIVKDNSKRLEATNLMSRYFERIQRCSSRGQLHSLLRSITTGTGGDFTGTYTDDDGTVYNIGVAKIDTISGVDNNSHIFTIEFDVSALASTDLLKIYSKVKWDVSKSIVMEMYSLE